MSSGKYIINEINVQNCNDKGISIGENSISEMTNISINNSEFGIAIKDSSEMKSENVKVENSILCISIYRKKQEFGPSYAWIKNLECNIESSNFIQKDLSLKLESRKEYKFLLTKKQIAELFNVFENKIETLYPKKIITSLYMDTVDFSIYNNSIFLDVNKFKVRYRTYSSDNSIYEEIKTNTMNGKGSL